MCTCVLVYLCACVPVCLGEWGQVVVNKAELAHSVALLMPIQFLNSLNGCRFKTASTFFWKEENNALRLPKLQRLKKVWLLHPACVRV